MFLRIVFPLAIIAQLQFSKTIPESLFLLIWLFGYRGIVAIIIYINARVVVVRAVIVDDIVIIAGAVEEDTICVVVLNHIVVNFISA